MYDSDGHEPYWVWSIYNNISTFCGTIWIVGQAMVDPFPKQYFVKHSNVSYYGNMPDSSSVGSAVVSVMELKGQYQLWLVAPLHRWHWPLWTTSGQYAQVLLEKSNWCECFCWGSPLGLISMLSFILQIISNCDRSTINDDEKDVEKLYLWNIII